MSFASKAQMRFLYSTEPKVAREMTKTQDKSKDEVTDSCISYFEKK